MSVPVGKRKQSDFEVIKHFYRLRRDMTELILRDFGFSEKKYNKKLSKMFGGIPYDELNDSQKDHYDKKASLNDAFMEWYIGHQRGIIIDCIGNVTKHIFIANSIYPSAIEELTERRIHQDIAIGECFRMLQELQYTIETLPVDINKYHIFIENINKEINLLKAWRKSDNKFKRALSENASNFANVNNNGNANNNNATNAGGVRPRFR